MRVLDKKFTGSVYVSRQWTRFVHIRLRTI